MEPTKTTKLQIAAFIIQCVGVISIVFAAFSLNVAKKGIVDQHEWNRRHYTVTLLKDFNSDVEQFKDKVLRAYPGLYDSKQARSLTTEEAEALFRVDPAKDPATYEIRTSVIKFLNYMEFVCTAYQANVVHQETVYTLYHGLFLRSYQFFRPFIEIAQRELGGQQFKPVVDVCDHWQQLKNQNKFVPMPPTGTF